MTSVVFGAELKLMEDLVLRNDGGLGDGGNGTRQASSNDTPSTARCGVGAAYTGSGGVGEGGRGT